jgi:hypothetical protein
LDPDPQLPDDLNVRVDRNRVACGVLINHAPLTVTVMRNLRIIPVRALFARTGVSVPDAL